MNGLSIPYFNVEQWSSSPGALRLGSALLHFIWQGAALGLLAFIVLALLHRARPQIRYAALLAILVAMVTCPTATFLIADTQHGTVTLSRQPEVVLADRPTSSGDNKPAPAAMTVRDVPPSNDSVPLTESHNLHQNPAAEHTAGSPTVPTLTWNNHWTAVGDWLRHHRHQIVAAWMFGVCVLSLRLTIGLFGAERARRRGITPVPDSVEQTARQLAERLGIRRPVRVVVAALAEVPALVGWLRPVILLPFSTLNGLTPDQLAAILAHELAHVRRHDYLVNLLQTVVETILFYHPAVWWISRRIRQEREHCCDDCAVALCGDRIAYARTLATLEQLRAPVIAVPADGGSLIVRIRRLLGQPEPMHNGRFTIAAIAVVMLLLFGTMVEWQHSSIAGDEPAKIAAPSNTGKSGDVHTTEPKSLKGDNVANTEAAKTYRIRLNAKRTEYRENKNDGLPDLPAEMLLADDVQIMIATPDGKELLIMADRAVIRCVPQSEDQRRNLVLSVDRMQISLGGNVRFWRDARTAKRNRASLTARGLQVVIPPGRLEADQVQMLFEDVTLEAGSLSLNEFGFLGPVNSGNIKPDEQASQAQDESSKRTKPADDTKSAAPKTQKPWSVRGRVTDGNGKPIQGVTVHASTGIGSLRTTGKADTDTDGKYEFSFGPGISMANNDVQLQAATIAVHKAGFFEKNLSRQGDLVAALKLPEGEIGWGGKTKDDVILPGKPRELDFVMLPAAKVAGTLIDQDKKPLAGYGVSLTGPDLPPSSSVVAQTKTDEQGRFAIADIPTGFVYQFLIEPAKREPPWNAWASGLFLFKVPADGDDVSVQYDLTMPSARKSDLLLIGPQSATVPGRAIMAHRLEIQVFGTGTNWKEALRTGATDTNQARWSWTAPAKSLPTRPRAQSKSTRNGTIAPTKELHPADSGLPAETARLVLNVPRGDLQAPREKAPDSPGVGANASKTNLKRTKPDADGKFTITFENPVPRRATTRLELDPEKHQVIFQVFVRNAEGKLQEKIFKQLAARKTGGYQVNVQVKPDLIEHVQVSLTFVTIQPDHDKWVKAFFHDGKGTTYSGMWSGDGGKLPAVAVDDNVTGWIPEPERDVKTGKTD